MTLQQQVYAELEQLLPQMIAVRREIHQDPEVMFDVVRTAERVATRLASWGLEVQRGVGPHFGRGVVGVLKGALPGATIALRADMDALPIEEAGNAPYRSAQPGAMHACGHDAHTAMLLGAAEVLSRKRERLPGEIRFIFQAAEEGALPSPLDGTMVSGGRDLIDGGVLDGVARCFALHVWPQLASGQMGIHRDIAMAASTHFQISFEGVGGHHSSPHLAVDALAMATQFIGDVKYALATVLDPMEASVLVFGSLHAGNAPNAIAGHSELAGTYRVLSQPLVGKLHDILESRAAAVSAQYGGSYRSRYRLGTVLRNAESEVDRVLHTGRVIFGEDRTHLWTKPSLAGEDFALYSQTVPSAFAFIGIAHPEWETVYPLHHPQFEIDEQALSGGAKLLAGWALAALGVSGEADDLGESGGKEQ